MRIAVACPEDDGRAPTVGLSVSSAPTGNLVWWPDWDCPEDQAYDHL